MYKTVFFPPYFTHSCFVPLFATTAACASTSR